MKKFLLFWGLALFCLCQSPFLHAAISSVNPSYILEKEAAKKTSVHKNKKARKWKKRMGRLQKKMEKKMARLRQKGKSDNQFGLGFIGLLILVAGVLLILLGLAIPVVGFIFWVPGAIVAFVGLLWLVIFGGADIDLS